MNRDPIGDLQLAEEMKALEDFPPAAGSMRETLLRALLELRARRAADKAAGK